MEKIFWCDKLVDEILEREEKLKEKSNQFITESGLGASGIPHIGSAGDGIRAYMIALALKDAGLKSTYIAFADDRDGLRKVPMGFPDSLEEYIGMPVSHIPDLEGCHKNYGEHMSSLLIDALEKIGIEFEPLSSDKVYESGRLDNEIKEILTNGKKAGELIKEYTLQDKYLHQLPYYAMCEGCGKIYTTRVTDFHGDKVHYICDEEFIGKNSNTEKEITIKGCGYEGETSMRNGKLQWKVEFAARWKALKVNFEAFGKDILDSIKINDVICREILNFEPPVHALYELFVERGGQRISKSKGNVFTPQVWLEYGTPESMRLLMLKRLNYTRVVDLFEIPKLMDEVDHLVKVYSGELEMSNEKEEKHLKRLYEYVYLLNAPEEKPLTISYHTLINICNVLPEEMDSRYELIKNILLKTKLLPKEFDESELKKKIEYATNFVKDVGETGKKKIELNDLKRKALEIFKEELRENMDAEEIQTLIFETSKKNEVRPRDFFRTIYSVILGVDQGPRAGSLIKIIGVERVKKILSDRIQ